MMKLKSASERSSHAKSETKAGRKGGHKDMMKRDGKMHGGKK